MTRLRALKVVERYPTLEYDIVRIAHEEAGFAAVKGLASRRSEWGVEYELFGNCSPRSDDAEVEQRTPEEMIDRWRARLAVERSAGNNTIVWRTMPDLTVAADGRLHLYFRCYFAAFAHMPFEATSTGAAVAA